MFKMIKKRSFYKSSPAIYTKHVVIHPLKNSQYRELPYLANRAEVHTQQGI